MKNILPIGLAISLVWVAGCHSEPKQWRSDHFNITATLLPGWRTSGLTEPHDGYDRAGELEVGFLHKAAQSAYVIKVDSDDPMSQLSPKLQLASYRKQFRTTAGLELVDDTEVTFHNHTFRRFRIKMPGSKGPVANYIHVRHDGGRMTKILWLFPVADDGAMDVPDVITEFDRSVQLDI
jgi:hypothetical protein